MTDSSAASVPMSAGVNIVRMYDVARDAADMFRAWRPKAHHCSALRASNEFQSLRSRLPRLHGCSCSCSCSCAAVDSCSAQYTCHSVSS